MPLSVANFDLASIYTAAQQARANQMAFEDRKTARELAPKIAAARRAYMAGNKEPLALLAPDEFAKFENMSMRQGEQDLKEQRFKLDAATSVQKLQEQKLGLLGRVMPALQRSPQSARAVQQYLGQTGLFGEQELAQLADPAAVQRMAQVLPQMAGAVNDQNFPQALATAASEFGYSPNEYEKAVKDAKVQQRMVEIRNQGAKAKAASGGTVNVYGNQPLEKTPKAKLQGELVEDEQILSDLKSIEGMDYNRFLTTQGRVKGWALKKLDYLDTLGKDSQEWLAQRRTFQETVEQVFNAYRQRITGAAASDTELVRLKDSMLNKDLSPSEFRGSFQRFMDKMQRGMRIKRRVLREGLDVSPDERQKHMDELYRSSDQVNGADDVKDRLKSVLDSGVQLDAAVQQMVTEGYWTQDQADDFLIRAKAKVVQ
jgi:hypothetical protein